MAASGLLTGAFLLAACSSVSPNSAASPTEADVTTAPSSLTSAEPLAERTVAVDEDGSRVSADPVQPSETVAADPNGRVSLQLLEVEAVQGEAMLPGEIAGPALRLTLQVSNDTGEVLDTTAAVVNVDYGAEAIPANTFQQPGGEPLPGLVEAGSTATGTYLFDVPVNERGDVRIEVDIAPELQLVVFDGDLSSW